MSRLEFVQRHRRLIAWVLAIALVIAAVPAVEDFVAGFFLAMDGRA